MGAGGAHSAEVFHVAVRATVAIRAVTFQLTLGAGVAHRPVLFPLAVREGVTHRAALFPPAVGAGLAHRAAMFQLAVRAGVAHRPVLFLLAVGALLLSAITAVQSSRLLPREPVSSSSACHGVRSYPREAECRSFSFRCPRYKISFIGSPETVCSYGRQSRPAPLKFPGNSCIVSENAAARTVSE